ncbi:phage adaptor protein [Pseudothauera rhizosphaerae]|uniref:Uncharacterized protein n=1 Tax=Pseudothauera rhizosphaerae TaxID=2565932 RepID=A0A4S4AAH8_9RHOO|nr:hypothetical protein [Pseudothauera rhizosphaerae]THF55915.1 hypothetical protein E6O51_20225 [Pseudothauera rhizosphaerae]
MNAGELIDIVRREIGDREQPYFNTDDDLIEFADDAQNEACRRASLLVDSNSDFCRIDVEEGEAEYEIDSRIIRIRRARLVGVVRPMSLMPTAHLDSQCLGWEDMAGEPSIIVTDWKTGAIRLAPTPDAAATLLLRVVRLPLHPIKSLDSTFEVNPRFIRDLRHWIIKRAYDKKDADAEDVALAVRAEGRFIAAFGEALPARTEEWNARNLPFDNLDASE